MTDSDNQELEPYRGCVPQQESDDNILQDPDEALKLGKSISKTEAEIAEEERLAHETDERLVTEKLTSIEESDDSDGEPANRPTGRRRPIGKLTKFSHKPEAQVKELILPQRFLMILKESLQPQVKELGSQDESDWSDDAKVNEGEIEWLTSDDKEDT
ncbi:hypothetical protein Tco_0030675 [Tanacetum coccineum]